MLCDHQLVVENINDYVEGTLSPTLKQQVSQQIESCADCLATYQQCKDLYHMSSNWQQQEVPEWHRTRFAVRPPVKTSNWLNWSAMASSTLAILMVVFQLEINSGDQGLMISFGGNQNETKISQMVQAQLAEYKKEQDSVFQVKLDQALDTQNVQMKLSLANWIEKNRDERQQEIKFVMRGWQSQRYEDQQNVDRQLSYMANNQIENNQVINKLIQSVGNGSASNDDLNQPSKL